MLLIFRIGISKIEDYLEIILDSKIGMRIDKDNGLMLDLRI